MENKINITDDDTQGHVSTDRVVPKVAPKTDRAAPKDDDTQGHRAAPKTDRAAP